MSLYASMFSQREFMFFGYEIQNTSDLLSKRSFIQALQIGFQLTKTKTITESRINEKEKKRVSFGELVTVLCGLDIELCPKKMNFSLVKPLTCQLNCLYIPNKTMTEPYREKNN